jgi:hypothetical protein
MPFSILKNIVKLLNPIYVGSIGCALHYSHKAVTVVSGEASSTLLLLKTVDEGEGGHMHMQ